MNRRQEIAAWIFGLVIALGLIATDNGVWAILVLAVLTILSLRDRQKKKQKNINTAAFPPVQVDPTSTETDQSLRNLTPHILATVMLQRAAEGKMPFQEWRKSDAEIPERAEAMVGLYCASAFNSGFS